MVKEPSLEDRAPAGNRYPHCLYLTIRLLETEIATVRTTHAGHRRIPMTGLLSLPPAPQAPACTGVQRNSTRTEVLDRTDSSIASLPLAVKG